MYKYYSNLRNEEKVNTFVFPETLKQANTALKNWSTVKQLDEMVIDLRDEEEKENARLSKLPNTLINDLNMWEELPKIISSQVVNEPESRWNPSIHFLE